MPKVHMYRMNALNTKGIYVMRSCVATLSILFFSSHVLADYEALDVYAVLPLLEVNSIERKMLDVSYSLNCEMTSHGEVISSKVDVHLVFDAETGKFREETKEYDKPGDTSAYRLTVDVWDGEEFVSLFRPVSKEVGRRALKSGAYEYPGHAVILSPPMPRVPDYAQFFFDALRCSFIKLIPEYNPQLRNITGDSIIIETTWCKVEFSKKTGAIKKFDHYNYNTKRAEHYNNEEKIPWKTYEFSDHVECSGVWIPLRCVGTYLTPTGEPWCKKEYSVDPKTLRLLDTVDDLSIFKENLLAGCAVTDQIRKKTYEVTTLDTTLPNDVDAIQKMLEKLLEQADEQKAAIEEEIKAKKKKK